MRETFFFTKRDASPTSRKSQSHCNGCYKKSLIKTVCYLFFVIYYLLFVMSWLLRAPNASE